MTEGRTLCAVCGVRTRTRGMVLCIPLVCRELHAQPDFPLSRAGTDWTEANFGMARAADEARGVKIESVARRVKCAAGRPKGG